MRLVIVGTDLPGLFGGNVHVGVQRGAEPEQLAPGDAEQVSFTVELTVRRPDGLLDFTGSYVHGRRGDRFVYLTWGQVSDGSFEMFRRAKITLDPGNPVLGQAAETGAAVSVRLGLTDARGGPLCARVAPDRLDWAITA